MKSGLKKLLNFPSRSISRRLLAVTLIMSSIITTFITGFQLAFDYFEEVHTIENSLNLVSKAYLKSLEGSLWELHNGQLKTDLDGILSIPGVRFAEIKSPQSGIFIQAGIKPQGRILEKTFQLRFEPRTGRMAELGTLSVSADMDEVYQRLSRKALFIFLTQLIKTLIISMAIYVAIQYLLTRHLIQITDYLKKLEIKNDSHYLRLDRHTDSQKQDELDCMVDSINQMHRKLKKSYDQLEELNQELETKVSEKTKTILEQRQKLEYTAKMRSLGEMAGGIAHEINSPLAIIGMRNELILRMARSTEIDREALLSSGKVIEKTVKRIAHIIQSLLNFSRDGSRDPLSPASLSEILRDTLYFCQQKLMKANIELITSDIPDDLIINCRPVEISQVLLNLLHNASDAAQDTTDKWIHVEVKESSDLLTLSVTDSGSGIPLRMRRHIFQPFFSTKAAGKGTGLGLSISKRIIEDHGGTLILDETHAYTRFVVSLPKIATQQAINL